LTADAVRTASTVGPQWPVHFTASHPVEVMGDPTRLRQVIDNLLANVRAHTPEGTPTTVHVDQDGDRAEIVVKDAGPGMPSDEAARVFERFYRVDASRARGHGGSGLGLSIVAAIVAAHGGTVSASSAVDQGMTVAVRIPVIAEIPESGEVSVAGRENDALSAARPGAWGAGIESVGGVDGADATNGPVDSNGVAEKGQAKGSNGAVVRHGSAESSAESSAEPHLF
jgi:two-component system OmpR family sensor kinase